VPEISDQVAAGVVAVYLNEVAGDPGTTIRVPITVKNATDLSPYGLDFNLRYPTEIVDPTGSVSVEKSALLSGVGVQVNTTEQGRVRITERPHREQAPSRVRGCCSTSSCRSHQTLRLEHVERYTLTISLTA
jgi:hypothetical protein